MSRLLLTVEKCDAEERGSLLLHPGLRSDGPPEFIVGDPLLLRRPDGSETHTKVYGVESLCLKTHDEVRIMVTGLTPEDIPPGTEVWLREDDGPVDATDAAGDAEGREER